MVALLAMEPPIRLNTEEIRAEKVKVFRAMRPISERKVNEFFVRGQYDAGFINGEYVPAYRAEPMVDKNSRTETFVAGKLLIDNFRWAGVPFYIRTGKRMKTKTVKIVIQFKDVPMNLYYQHEKILNPNLLVIHIQPKEGLTLHLNAKKSGQSFDTMPITLNYSSQTTEGINISKPMKTAYDVFIGDATNFTHWDEVALSWSLMDPISVSGKNRAGFQLFFGNDKAMSSLPKTVFWWPVTDLDVDK